MRSATLIAGLLPFLYFGARDQIFHMQGRRVSMSEHLLHLTIGITIVMMVMQALRRTTAEIQLQEYAGDAAAANDFDRIGQALVMRGADPNGFRRAATALGALTVATYPLRRARRREFHQNSGSSSVDVDSERQPGAPGPRPTSSDSLARV